VPHSFHERAVKLYAKIGNPLVSSDTFWETYRLLLQCFRDEVENDAELPAILTMHCDTMQHLDVDKEEVELLPNMKPFRNGDNIIGPRGHRYIGGLAQPPMEGLQGRAGLEEGRQDSDGKLGVVEPEYAYFTTDEDEDGNESLHSNE
jgi:hypothetical protein